MAYPLSVPIHVLEYPVVTAYSEFRPTAVFETEAVVVLSPVIDEPLPLWYPIYVFAVPFTNSPALYPNKHTFEAVEAILFPAFAPTIVE